MHQRDYITDILVKGKTVLCSYIIQTLTDTPDLTTCYYFCNNQEYDNVCLQILAVIVLQIIRQQPEICSLIANEFAYRVVNCGVAQLRILVPRLLELVAYTRIVVDGIDECSKDNQKIILKELKGVIASSSHCKVLFSSRKEVHIQEKLAKNQISLDGRKEVDLDIRSLIKYKITKLPTSNQDVLDRIESTLVEKANGNKSWCLISTITLTFVQACFCGFDWLLGN